MLLLPHDAVRPRSSAISTLVFQQDDAPTAFGGAYDRVVSKSIAVEAQILAGKRRDISSQDAAPVTEGWFVAGGVTGIHNVATTQKGAVAIFAGLEADRGTWDAAFRYGVPAGVMGSQALGIGVVTLTPMVTIGYALRHDDRAAAAHYNSFAVGGALRHGWFAQLGCGLGVGPVWAQLNWVQSRQVEGDWNGNFHVPPSAVRLSNGVAVTPSSQVNMRIGFNLHP
jgi:hypothetical protein